MAKFINVDELAKVIKNQIDIDNRIINKGDMDDLSNIRLTGEAKGYGCALCFIEAQPAADVIEARHGKWSNEMIAYTTPSDINCNSDTHFGYRCSVCGGIYNKTDFCGGCGARMDKEG